MRSPRETDAASEMFFLFNTVQECLLYLCRLTGFDWLIFTCFNAAQNLNLTMRTRTTKNLK